MSLFVEGKLFNIANAESGGGSGDQHNLGWYATPEALRTAHPTANNGDWAIVGSTDTVWVWDSDTTVWKDTDSKAEVTPDMVIIKSATMPTASTVAAGAIYMYTGLSNATYTNGYIYKNVKTATYTGTVSFEAATLSGTTVSCSGDDFAAFLAQWSDGDIVTITNGTMTYLASGDLWRIEGLDADSQTVDAFQLYQQDYEDAGFVFTGTPSDGDVISFTCGVTEASATYAWTRIDVQPTPEPGQTIQYSTMPTASADNVDDIVQFVGTTTANYTNGYFYKCVSDGQSPATYSWEEVSLGGSSLPDMTGQSGKILTNDGSAASWSDTVPALNVRGTDNSRVELYQNGKMRLYSDNTYYAQIESRSISALDIGETSGGSQAVLTTVDFSGYNNFGYSFGPVIGRKNSILSAIFVNKICNAYAGTSYNISVPRKTGTMVVADYTGATAGQVLTLDSNLQPVWQAGGSGGGISDVTVNGTSVVSGGVAAITCATIDDTSTSSQTATWSASKLNTTIGDIETLINAL